MTEFYHDTRRNISIYPRAPGQIEQYIPEARPINGSLIAVPHTLQNAQTLRWLNYPVAPVMITAQDGCEHPGAYDWPAAPGVTPWESQRIAANFMVLHPRCFNLSDMGVGKTLAALWAADWLMTKHPGFRALVVCPLSIMERVWANAIFKNFLSRRTFEILHGSASARTTALARPADFYIINFDGVGVGAHTRKTYELDGFSKALCDRSDIRLAIVDEASAYKDASTRRHRIARDIIGKRPYLWLMTGTPTPNAPTDAFGLAKLVNNAMGKSKTTFQMETMVKVSNFVWRPAKDGYDKARKLLTPAIRFDIREVWDSLGTTTQQRQVELTTDQKKLMADLKRDLQITLKSGQPVSAVNEVAARSKFLQISLGAVYDSRHAWHAVDAEPRYAEIEAVVEQAKHKIVCFVPLTSVVERVYKRLSKRWKCAVINGNVSAKDRAIIIQRFAEEPNLRCVICDPGCTAHGINEFVVADTVIWAGAIDKSELYLQGIKRVDRPGQRNPTTVVQIVSNKLEQEIFRRLETNTSLQGVLLDAVRRGDL